MTDGWDMSAPAWIADMGDAGDFTRQHIMDAPMLGRVAQAQARTVLDIGAGEGRFCRMLAARGIEATGLEPTAQLIAEARDRDPQGRYVQGRAEQLPFGDAGFDMAVFYLSLIDIEGLDAAFCEAIRVLRPGGRILIGNLSSFATAVPEGSQQGWTRVGEGMVYSCDHYHTERSFLIGWRGIRVRNYHRTLAQYMEALLSRGMRLSHFAEPKPTGGDAARRAQFSRAPMFVLMEWVKPD